MLHITTFTRSFSSVRWRVHPIQQTAEGLVTDLGTDVHQAVGLADDVTGAALSCSVCLDVDCRDG